MSLPPERYRLELIKTLKQAEEPSEFFYVLDEVGALEQTFPELADLQGVTAGPEQWHGEGDTFEHTMMVLEEAKKLRSDDPLLLLMAIAHDLGKAVTQEEDLPSHPGHAKNGVPIAEDMARRLSMSNEQRKAMKDAALMHMRLNDSEDLRASTVIEMVQNAQDIDRLLDLTHADTQGRIPKGDFDRQKAQARIDAAQQAVDEWDGKRLIEAGHSPDEMGGEDFGNLLHQKRVERMRELER